jgi:hypothetical protein
MPLITLEGSQLKTSRMGSVYEVNNADGGRIAASTVLGLGRQTAEEAGGRLSRRQGLQDRVVASWA